MFRKELNNFFNNLVKRINPKQSLSSDNSIIKGTTHFKLIAIKSEDNYYEIKEINHFIYFLKDYKNGQDVFETLVHEFTHFYFNHQKLKKFSQRRKSEVEIDEFATNHNNNALKEDHIPAFFDKMKYLSSDYWIIKL